MIFYITKTFIVRISMVDYMKELVTAKQVEVILKSKKKTRFWFHNLGARHNLLPAPIIKANYTYVKRKLRKVLPGHVQKKLKKLKGRTVYYPREIKAYLGLIIELKDVKGLSFERITKDVKVVRELNKLNYLASTNLYVDPLTRDEGFLTNFRVAKRMLIERYGVGGNGVLSEVFGRISEEAECDYRKYHEINTKIRDHALRYEVVDKELEKEKRRLAYNVNLSLKIMEVTTKTALEGVRKKEISQMEWFNMVKELDNEDSGGVSINRHR
jgi:hypothetical protein